MKTMDEHGVPLSMQGALRRYMEERIEPGAGLRRILENRPVVEVIQGLDPHCAAHLRGIVSYLVNEAPADCYGSWEAVAAWLRIAPPPRWVSVPYKSDGGPRWMVKRVHYEWWEKRGRWLQKDSPGFASRVVDTRDEAIALAAELTRKGDADA